METTHEAGRHFFRVYGVLTRRFIFSPEALRLPFSVRETSSEEERRSQDHITLGACSVSVDLYATEYALTINLSQWGQSQTVKLIWMS